MTRRSKSFGLIAVLCWAVGCHSSETMTGADTAVDFAHNDSASDNELPSQDDSAIDASMDRPMDSLMDLPRDLGRPEVRMDAVLPDIPVDTRRRCPFDSAAGDAGVDVIVTGPQPRLVGPLSTTRVTTQRPSLWYELPEGLARARLELCDDPRCGRVFLTLPLPETTGVGRVRPERTLRPGVVFWRMVADSRDGSGERVSHTWEFGVGHRDTPLDSSHGTISDFEGDGYDDIAVADYWTHEGIIYAFSGSASGLRTTPSATIPAPSGVIGSFGTNKTMGDVDRDGLADLVTSDGVSFGTNAAHVFRGCRDGLAELPSQVVSPELFGGPSRFLSSLGDINGDGYSDFAKWGFDEDGDYPHIMLGGSLGLRVVRLDTNVYCAGCGTGVIFGLGDVNGDGYGDLLWTAGRRGTFLAGVILGRPDGPGNRADYAIQPVPRMLSAFGGEDLGVGDLDGDGMGEFIIRDPPYTYLYRGARDLTGARPIAEIDPPGRPDVAILYVGIPVPGDVDGDGVLDIVFPAPNPGYENPDAGIFMGSVYRYHLTIAGFSDQRIILGTSEEERRFGGSVTVQGDLNGDGYSDLVTSSVHSGMFPYHLPLFYGSPRGLPDAPNMDLVFRIDGVMSSYIMPM